MVDRFDSREPFTWHGTSFTAGALARMDGKPQSANPCQQGSSFWKAWNAGWADTDAGIQADREATPPAGDERKNDA